jgi:metallo-beta-lactamase class B
MRRPTVVRLSLAASALTAAATLLAAAPLAAQLTIRLTAVPAGTPPGARVHVAGTFNGWNPGAPGWALAPQPGGGYAITLPDSVRGAVAFKFTLGGWERVETAADGGDVPNRTAVVPSAGAADYAGAVAAWRAGAPAPARSTASASVRVLSDSFAMPQLGGRRRRVWLYLPPGYATSGRRYPVLYLHDGQNVFDASTSFAGEWGVDETLDSLAARGDRGAIVVAVDNGGPRRIDEYHPWRHPKHGGGEGDAYVDFLARTLKPYVDRHYRTLPDARHTAVAGSSMGGLISLYAALRRPDVFGRAGVFSCACWIARPQIYALARSARPGRTPARFYFVAGAAETPDGGPARDQTEMVRTLAAAGFPPGRAVVARVAADGKHAEWFWRREFAAAYRWLLADAPPARPTPPR